MNTRMTHSAALVMLVVLGASGCVGHSQTPTTPLDPPASDERASGDVILQDPETGASRSVPPRDTTSRPVSPELGAVGRWLPPFEGDIAAVSMAVLPDRRVLYWDGAEENGAGPTHWPAGNHPLAAAESRVLNLASGKPQIEDTVKRFYADDEDIFCSGFTMLPDGRVLGAGGGRWSDGEFDLAGSSGDGLDTARVFNPANNTWTNVDLLTLGRWYPTLLMAPDGNPVAASGLGHIKDFRTHWDSFEVYDVADDDWSVLQGTMGHNLPLYPHLHLLPGGQLSGHAFFAASGTMWGPFGAHPQQGEWSTFQSADLEGDRWFEYGPSLYGARGYASTALLAGDPSLDYAPTIISSGGTLYQGTVATPFTEIIDASVDPPRSREGPRLHHARWHHQTVLLPDGTALVVGGGTIDTTITWGPENRAIMEPELFDAATMSWRLQAPMSVERAYHSTAVLLPDGRVLLGGHVPLPSGTEAEREVLRPPIVETRFEIFEPGYLFRGERPVIRSAPTHIDYGETFFVELEGRNDIASVMLMRTATTTHAWDANQRATYLEVVEQVEGGVLVRAPPTSTVSPPGPHMLFVNQAHPSGPIPSVAAMLSLGVSPPAANEVVRI